MTDQTSEDPLSQLQQTVASMGRTQAQTDEILLLLARRSSEHDQELQAVRETLRDMSQTMQSLDERLRQTNETLDRTALLQEQNTTAITELRTILRERYNGNGQPTD